MASTGSGLRRPTRLEQELSRPRPTPLAVYEAARRMFLATHRVDMGQLATEAGVSRATLNRWVGSRDRLLGEILHEIADRAFTRSEAEVTGAGPARVVGVLHAFFTGVLDEGPFREFLHASPQTALALCTSNQGPVQARVITRIEALLQAEGVTGDAHLSRHTLAYALLRIGESFVYTDVITGAEPSADAARPIFERMLRIS